MNVFEFAMKMELDGKEWYEKAAAQTQDSALKNILLEMAEDEQKHYEVFKAYRDGAESLEMPPSTTVLTNAKNFFERMAASGPVEFGGDEIDVWRQLLENESNAEKFYTEKAAEAEDDDTRKALESIAAEEYRHRMLIEHMISFLSAPKTWLENAEWHHIESY